MMARKQIMTGLKPSRLISQSNNRTGNIQETGNKSNCRAMKISAEKRIYNVMKNINLMDMEQKLTLSMTNTVVQMPEGVEGPAVSLFRNMTCVNPCDTVNLWEFLLTADYYDWVEVYRWSNDKKERERIKKFDLPCVTVAGIFDTRAKKRLQHIHSRCICIDIDGKQNPNVRRRWGLAKKILKKQFSSLCYAGLSIGGNGLCLVFRIAYPERHKDQFYALVDEIQERTGLIVDESGSDVVRLRVASYDPKPYFNPNAVPYLHCKPNRYAAPRKIKRPMTAKVEEKAKQRCYLLIDIICEKKKDITRGRKIWIGIGQALAGLFGDVEGRRLFHLVSQWHPDYYHTECESMFEWCMRRHSEVDIATFFYHCRVHGLTFK